MPRSRPVRAALRTVAIGGLALTGVALLAGCGSGGGEGRVTLPPGISGAPGDITLPDDVAITRPIDEAPIEPAPENPAPATDPTPPVDAPPAATPAPDAGVDLDEATTDGDVMWWPWAMGIIVVLVVMGILAAILSHSRRGGSGWTTRALTAIDTSEALTTHLLAIAPEGLVVVARADAQQLADLEVTTQDLARTAPDDRTRGSIDGLRGPLLQLHAAVDMVSLSPTPTPAQLTLVHQWANALHVAASTARATVTTPAS